MTQGLAAGPYGDPSRWDLALNDNMTRQEALSGGYERWVSSLSILIYTAMCIYTMCIQYACIHHTYRSILYILPY